MAFEDDTFEVDVRVTFKRASDGVVFGTRHAEISCLSYPALVEVQGVLLGVEQGLHELGKGRAVKVRS